MMWRVRTPPMPGRARDASDPQPPLLPGEVAQVLVAVEQYVVEPHERRSVGEHLLADVLAAEPLLERVEAGRGAAVDIGDTLRFAANEEFAVEHTLGAKGFGDVRKTARNVIARTAVEPGLAAGVDELDANAVPLPLGGIVIERYLGRVERMGEHERPEHRHVSRRWLLGAAFGPVEQLGERRAKSMPHFLHPFSLQPQSRSPRPPRPPPAYFHPKPPQGPP